MKSATARFLATNGLLLLLSIAIGVALTVFAGTERSWAIGYSFLSAILLLTLSLALEYRILPTEFRSLRSDIAAATSAARRDRILRLVLNQVVRDLREDVVALRAGTYADDKGSIPELSIRTIEAVTGSAFATYVADTREDLYQQPQGRRYLEAWYRKAKELAGRGELCRLFIVEDLAEVSEETLQLIREHEANGVRVILASREAVEHVAEGCTTDFGRFDSGCLMTVTPGAGSLTRLEVVVHNESGTNDGILERYSRFESRLRLAALDIDTFFNKFRHPVNAEFWNQWHVNYPAPLGPPHGLSAKDAIAMMELIGERAEGLDGLRVAVLGLTRQLVEACLKFDRIVEVVLIDQTHVTFASGDRRVKRLRANWLGWHTNEPFDAVVGDETLNNLRISQYGTFFENIRSLLKDNGILVMRTLGRYGGSARFARVPPEDLLHFMRDTELSDRDSERAAHVIAYLHSSFIAFDEVQSLIDNVRYNALIQTWVERRDVSEERAASFWFPSKDGPRLLLSSPDTDIILSRSRRTFDQMPFIEVDRGYCGSDGRLNSFYRITPFVPKVQANGGNWQSDSAQGV